MVKNHDSISPTAWILAGLAAFSGTALYIITSGGRDGAIASLLWGSLYGFGYLILSQFLSPQPGFGGVLYFILGTFVWPLIVTVALAFYFDKLLSYYNKTVMISIFVATNLLVYPMNYAKGTVVYYLPIFGVFLGNF